MNKSYLNKNKMKHRDIHIGTYLLLLGILVLGSLLRLYNLTTLPGGVHQDEATVALNAWNLFHEGTDLAGNANPIYMADWGDGHSALYVWLTLPFYLFTGGKWTLLASRLPQALIGILSILTSYGVGCRLWNNKMGLLSAFLLATCPWHIMMSRWGLDANLAPGFLLFSLYFFLRALSSSGKDMLLAALFYGITLYSYASIWVAVPVILLFMVAYAFASHRLHWDKSHRQWFLLSILLLGLLALPLLLFLLVNNGFLPSFKLGFFSIPLMKGYRGESMSFSPKVLLENLRSALYLLRYQNSGDHYSIIDRWGLFYPFGDLLILFGFLALLVNIILNFLHKKACMEWYIFAQLVGAGVTCTLTGAQVQRINALYIPLLFCEAYGIRKLLDFIRWLVEKRRFANHENAIRTKVCRYLPIASISIIFLVFTGLFWRDYSTSYNETASAYFGIGIRESVELALEKCAENGIDTISVEQAAQWPRVLLFSETPASVYQDTVEYDETFLTPAPKRFYTAGGIRINTRIDYERLTQDSVYIIYCADTPKFEADYELIEASPYWYVAVPTIEK